MVCLSTDSPCCLDTRSFLSIEPPYTSSSGELPGAPSIISNIKPKYLYISTSSPTTNNQPNPHHQSPFTYNLTMSSPRIAWIGLGNMGRGMVKNLVEKGQYTAPLLIYNRTAARTEKLISTLPQGKAKAITSIADAVKGADIIFACVANDQAINETISAALQVPESKGKLFVDCSTVHPDTTNALAKQVNAAGAEFVANPVFGAPAMADSGSLVCVLAGPKKQVDRVLPYCKGVMGRAEINYSDQPAGAATRLKIIVSLATSNSRSPINH